MSFAEMFSGIGGFRFGLGKWGWSCVWANDVDKYACQIYRKNFGEGELVEGDITKIEPKDIPDFDLLTAGFPCQSFSLAGKRKGFQDIRGTMFYEVVRVASAKRPKLLLLENVKGLLSNDNGKTFGTILEELGNIGYWCEWQTLNSKHFGVPQNRERVFIVGHLRSEPSKQIFPIGEIGESFGESCGKAQGTRSRIRGDCASVDSRTGSTARGQHLVASALIQSQGREPHIETRKDGVSHALKGKGGWEGNYLVANTLSHRYGKDGSENLIQIGELWEGSQCRVYDPNGISPTLHKSGGNTEPMIANTLDTSGWLRKQGRHEIGKHGLTDYRIRRLTPTECERLQGFPDGWTEGVSDTQRYKLLGNAVTTNVIQFLGERLLEVSGV